MHIDKDKYTKQLEAIRNEMKSTKYQRYNEIGGTYKTLEKMAELCTTIMNAYDTDWDLMYDKQLHKAVRSTDVLFELLEDAWIDRKIRLVRKEIESESPELDQEASIEDSE